MAYPGERLESSVVALHCLHAPTSRIPPVTVHLEGDMLGYWTLLQGANEQLSKLFERPFSWWRVEYESLQEGYNVAHIASAEVSICVWLVL